MLDEDIEERADALTPMRGAGSFLAALEEIKFDLMPECAADELIHSMTKRNKKIHILNADELEEVTDLIYLAGKSTPHTRDEAVRDTDDEQDWSPSTSIQSGEQQYRDYTSNYTVYIDTATPMNSDEADSIVEWSRAARRNSQKFFGHVDVELVDRTEWGGFVLRSKHILYTRALFHIRSAHNHSSLPKSSFQLGAILVQPGEYAKCGYCKATWDLDTTQGQNNSTRSEQEGIVLNMIEHSLNAHDPKNKRNHVVPACVKTYLQSTEGKFAPIAVHITKQKFAW